MFDKILSIIPDSWKVNMAAKSFVTLIFVIILAVVWGMNKLNDLEARLDAGLEYPKPGTGIYVKDKEDPNSDTWPPSGMEYNMKDDKIRSELKNLKEDYEDLKRRIERLEAYQ